MGECTKGNGEMEYRKGRADTKAGTDNGGKGYGRMVK